MISITRHPSIQLLGTWTLWRAGQQPQHAPGLECVLALDPLDGFVCQSKDARSKMAPLARGRQGSHRPTAGVCCPPVRVRCLLTKRSPGPPEFYERAGWINASQSSIGTSWLLSARQKVQALAEAPLRDSTSHTPQ